MAVKRGAATGVEKAGKTSTTRDTAEEQLSRSQKKSPELNGQTAEQLIHELQVHQIELEIQAEELRRSHLELMESRDQYLDLYEFAPLGYLTLDNRALISQANLSAAALLGVDRSSLIHARFRSWIVPEDLEMWDRYFINLLKAEKKLTANLMLKRGDKATFHARLEGIRLGPGGNGPLIRVAISDISDIRQAERARRDSEQLLKTVIELLPVGIMILDESGEAVAINPEMEKIWDRAPSLRIGQFPECKGWRLEDGIPIKAREWAGARAIWNGETTLEEQIEIECSGDIHKVVLNSALPIRRSDGALGGAVIVTQDLTEGKAAEERIQWLASFPELNPDPVIELDLSGTIIYTNPATSRVLSDLKLADDPALFIPWDRTEILRLIRKSPEPRLYREIGLGSEIFSEDIMLDPDLQVVRIYTRNITRRRKSEDALKESEEFNRSLVENLPDFIIVCGPDLRILYVNPAVVRVLGREAGTLAGTSLLRYVPEKDQDQVVAGIADFFRGGRISSQEIEILGKNRTGISAILQGKPIQYHGSPALLLLLTDITERKVLEDALKNEAKELLLLSNAFQAANRKLQLLSGLARHDINNHLTVVLGHLALFGEDRPGTIPPEIIQKVLASSRHIGDLIQFMKTYEEIGVKAPLFQDIRRLADEATHGLCGPVRLENNLPPGREIFADPLIVKVFFNLVDNAVRHGETITTLRFFGEEHDGDYWITCEDDGVGISADQKERIFERGYGKNTGLGLFLAREILSITGITIHECGEPGGGARFVIRVPRGMWHLAVRGG